MRITSFVGSVLPAPRRVVPSVRYLAATASIPAAATTAVAILVLDGRVAALGVCALLVVLYAAAAPVLGAREGAVAVLGRSPIEDPHHPGDDLAPVAVLRIRLREHATWRELAHAILTAATGPVVLMGLLVWASVLVLTAAPVLVRGGPVAAGPFTISTASQAWLGTLVALTTVLAGTHLVVLLADLRATIVAGFLGPRGEELRDRVRVLTRSRARLIDAFEVERQRIERDLHDGAQQQLVSLGMTLDLARIELEATAGHPAAPLVELAHDQALATLGELRELINGIHPPVLTTRGLGAAVETLAERAGMPVTIDAKLPQPLPREVESTAYFVIAEALTNAAKHSGANTVRIDLDGRRSALHLAVTDDGSGGADPDAGSGLVGLGDRVTALDGRLTVTSPPGGPTTVRAELPLPPA